MFTKLLVVILSQKAVLIFLFVIDFITCYGLCCSEDLDCWRCKILVVEYLMTFNKIFSYAILACCQVHYTTRVKYTIELALNMYTVFV